MQGNGPGHARIDLRADAQAFYSERLNDGPGRLAPGYDQLVHAEFN
jgi:hypothetical protein